MDCRSALPSRMRLTATRRRRRRNSATIRGRPIRWVARPRSESGRPSSIGTGSVMKKHWSGLAVLALLASCTQPPATDTAEPRPAVSGPNAAEPLSPNPLRNVYFGDLHLHTRNSFDAYVFNVRANPDDAYAYAKGQTIKH